MKKKMRVPPWGYIYTYILFVVLTFIFGIFTSSFVFYLLCLKFCLQKDFFPLLSFAFCVLTFGFLLLSFVFKLLYIVFWLWVSHAISMIKRHLSNPTNLKSRQTYRRTIDSVSDMGRRWK